MSEITLYLAEEETAIAENYAQLGFANQSELIAAALQLLQRHQEQSQFELQESAELYAEVYAEDTDLRDLTTSALPALPSEMPV